MWAWAACAHRGNTKLRIDGDGGLRVDLRCLLLTLLLALCIAAPAAESAELGRFLKGLQPSEIFPGADRLADLEGSPPVASAFRGGEHMGFVFLNSDVVNATGYSGKPIHVLLAMDLEGVIRGARLVEHERRGTHRLPHAVSTGPQVPRVPLL